MVLVSHDRSLLTSVCDQLYLIDDGTLTEFDSDLDEYSNQLLAKTNRAALGASKSLGSRKERRREEADARNRQSALKKPLVKKLNELEKQLARLQIQKEHIENTLAQTHLYEDEAKEELLGYLHDQATLSKEMNQAEEEWLSVSNELEEVDI